MRLYKTRPVVVEAVEVTKDSDEEIQNTFPGAIFALGPVGDRGDLAPVVIVPNPNDPFVTQTAFEGMFVVKVAGTQDIRVLTAGEFHRTFEPVAHL